MDVASQVKKNNPQESKGTGEGGDFYYGSKRIYLTTPGKPVARVRGKRRRSRHTRLADERKQYLGVEGRYMLDSSYGYNRQFQPNKKLQKWPRRQDNVD